MLPETSPTWQGTAFGPLADTTGPSRARRGHACGELPGQAVERGGSLWITYDHAGRLRGSHAGGRGPGELHHADRLDHIGRRRDSRRRSARAAWAGCRAHRAGPRRGRRSRPRRAPTAAGDRDAARRARSRRSPRSGGCGPHREPSRSRPVWSRPEGRPESDSRANGPRAIGRRRAKGGAWKPAEERDRRRSWGTVASPARRRPGSPDRTRYRT